MKQRPFPPSILFVLTLFLSIMIFVIGYAYSRRSGNTGLDMSKIHHIRRAALPSSTLSDAKP
ncbi:MAG: hypothetical protein H0X51_02430 [Parachlamydiaceae bacterium]|nr:hypothetical protein [Parachlamydiaceae bacterium]